MSTFEKLTGGFQKRADARFDQLADFFSRPNGKMCHSVQNKDKVHEIL
jgi:hypothetical protein